MFYESSGWRLFSIADVDVNISLWYLILMGFIIFLNPGLSGLLFALAITISLIIHEFGHAIPSKHYRLAPSILLHGFGGLCTHRPADTDAKDIVIVLAGPIIQIVVGAVAFAYLQMTNGSFFAARGLLDHFLLQFAWVSVIWGGANLLLPLYPLDGGQLFHLLLRRFTSEAKAQDWALKTSVFFAIPVGIIGIWQGFFFVAFLALFIIMDNVNTLRAGAALIDRKAKVRASSFVRDLLDQAEKAYAEQDWREAARLCHMARSGNDPIPPKMMERIWEILGVSTTEMGDYEEAHAWLERAPETSDVARAREIVEQALSKET